MKFILTDTWVFLNVRTHTSHQHIWGLENICNANWTSPAAALNWYLMQRNTLCYVSFLAFTPGKWFLLFIFQIRIKKKKKETNRTKRTPNTKHYLSSRYSLSLFLFELRDVLSCWLMMSKKERKTAFLSIKCFFFTIPLWQNIFRDSKSLQTPIRGRKWSSVQLCTSIFQCIQKSYSISQYIFRLLGNNALNIIMAACWLFVPILRGGRLMKWGLSSSEVCRLFFL